MSSDDDYYSDSDSEPKQLTLEEKLRRVDDEDKDFNHDIKKKYKQN